MAAKARDAHRMTQPISRRCHWSRCSECGLVALRNPSSRRGLDQKCPGENRATVQVLTPQQIRALGPLQGLLWESGR